MEYEACWRLQHSLFDALVARKRPGAQRTGPQHTVKQAAGTVKTTGEPNAPETAEATATAETTGPQQAVGEQNATAIAETPGSGETAANPEPAGTATGEDAGTVLFVEHPPVYTLGKSGHAENLLMDREALERSGATFFHIDRGGDITFHGPGQLVGYPILDLERLGVGLRAYIEALEEAVIRTVAHYGIRAGRIAGASGVWIGEDAEKSAGAPEGHARDAERAAGEPEGHARDAERAAGAPEGHVRDAEKAAGEPEGHVRDAERAAGEPEGHVRDAEKAAGEPEGNAPKAGQTAGSMEGKAKDAEKSAGKAAETFVRAKGPNAVNGLRDVAEPPASCTKKRAPRKICAIGVRSSRYVTMHGFALNVSTDLAWFSRINPCGFTDRGVTSIAAETGREVPMDEVKRILLGELATALRCRIVEPR